MANDGMSEFVSYVKNGVEAGDPTVIGILVAVIVGLFTLVVFAFLSGKKNKRSGVLLLGICDAGKTLLFSRLVYKTFKETYTSTKSNSGSYTVPDSNKSLRVIDLPGHERLRFQTMEEHKGLARAIIFVIDSLTFQKEIKEVAELLYTALSDSTISSLAPPVLILCNKQDMTLAKGAKVIQGQLEKEMNTLRVTRSAALQGTDNTSNNNTYLGKRNKDFEFLDVKPFKITFAECSCKGKGDNSKADLSEVESWLSKVA
ncbi:signal recognition particle receptor subunit beta-like [Haliotis asinina]|uniref:signal recognition particle receptor subunit beta-like n=1 Tax=Haliotis asinina TaxID=109174 RepID=UPI0035322D3D